MIKKFALLSILLHTILDAQENLKINKQTKYTASVVPKNMGVKVKKQRFMELVVPAIEKVYAQLDKQYYEMKKLVDANKSSSKMKELMVSYNANSKDELLVKIKPHKKFIAIAQAAMESSWATSRFTQVANNLFGIWSFNKNEPRVPANKKRGSKTIYLKKYPSLEASIRDYYKMIATGRAFAGFRAQKMKSDNYDVLVKKLDKYSERGSEYTQNLISMIKYNKFYKFD